MKDGNCISKEYDGVVWRSLNIVRRTLQLVIDDLDIIAHRERSGEVCLLIIKVSCQPTVNCQLRHGHEEAHGHHSSVQIVLS